MSTYSTKVTRARPAILCGTWTATGDLLVGNQITSSDRSQNLTGGVKSSLLDLINITHDDNIDEEFIKKCHTAFEGMHSSIQILQNKFNEGTEASEDQLRYYVTSIAINSSRKYLESLQDYAADVEKRGTNPYLFTQLRDGIKLWTFFQISHIHVMESYAKPFYEWMRTTRPALDISAIDPSQDMSSFWDAFYASISRMELSTASDLLKMHPRYNIQDKFMRSLESLLSGEYRFFGDSLNQTKNINHTSDHEFHEIFFKRRERCSILLERIQADGDCGIYAEFKELLLILAGDEEAIAKASTDWAERFLMHLVFVRPAAKRYEITNIIHTILHGNTRNLTDIDRLLLEILAGENINRVVLLMKEYVPLVVLVHLADILQYREVITASNMSEFSHRNLREELILQYIQSLVPLKAPFEVIGNYLSHLPSDPIHINLRHDLILKKTAHCLSDQQELKKIIQYCESHGQTFTQESIYTIVGMDYVKKDMLGKALQWFIPLQTNTHYAMQVADKMLESAYDDHGQVVKYLNDIDAETMEECGKAKFLKDYVMFMTLLERVDYEQAGKYLRRFLVEHEAPKRFWAKLLTFSIRILEDSHSKFSRDDIYQFMSCLQAVENAFNKKDFLVNITREELYNTKLALTRALSAAIMRKS
eukprot:CAMPEP_0114985018 /NCGR_PEP_ID=MMETSP0216-20121206/7615_1 /TAXON_ID=223996 /ORGANISM="Protocruzia adherens, Strain Boccale" /LENGTH=648 /DNA_ID=CAMNT_0002347251 /DNA_START=24 /DNA_END=1970 /DNA_ORIENTATION=+